MEAQRGTRWHFLQCARNLGIAQADFDLLGPYDDWKGVLERTRDAFHGFAHYSKTPEWNKYFETTHYTFNKSSAAEWMMTVIPPTERVWLMPWLNNNPNRGIEKLWVFEGTALACLSAVLEYPKDEYHIVSKKYDWLFYECHHEVLSAVGKFANLLSRYAEAQKL